jgi:DNA repair exonuclease SbcCD nuclease subunit
VALHGQGFAHRAVGENLVSNYPGRVPGWFNIGVLHTALMGRPLHDTYAPCTPGHLRARGYDYWALGHVHEYELVGTRPHIVFAGNLQGRSIREKGEKGAVLVSVADGDVTGMERLIVDRVRWEEASVDVHGFDSEAAVLKAVEEKLRPLAIIAADRLVALRVVLTGESEVHRLLVAHRDQLTDEVQAAAHRVNGDIWLERLDIKTHPPAAKRRAADPALLSVDLATLLGEVEGTGELKQKAERLLADVRVRIPGSVPEEEQNLAAELDQLVAEAREMLLARSTGDA